MLVVWKVLLDADSASGLRDIPSGSVGVAVAVLVVSCLAFEVAAVDLPVL